MTAETLNYDPNVCCAFATQTVRLTFGQWQYRKTLEVEVGGNCRGLSVIDCAVGSAYDKLEEDREGPFIVLTAPAEDGDGEDALHCSDDEDEGEDWLKEMLISAEIIKLEPEKDDP